MQATELGDLKRGSLKEMTEEKTREALWGCVYAVRHLGNCLQAIQDLQNKGDKTELIDGLIELVSEIVRPSDGSMSGCGTTLDDRLESIEYSYGRLLEEQNAFPALNADEISMAMKFLSVLRSAERSVQLELVLQICRQVERAKNPNSLKTVFLFNHDAVSGARRFKAAGGGRRTKIQLLGGASIVITGEYADLIWDDLKASIPEKINCKAEARGGA